MIHVIFICTGNICRSAMADGYLKYRIRKLNKQHEVRVTSAGTHAIQYQQATENAKHAIGKYGANIEVHTATTLENSDIEKADYILVMTKRHKDDVIKRYPNLENKIKLLGSYSKYKEYEQIDDPWGYNFSVYENCAKEIVDSIEGFIKEEL